MIIMWVVLLINFGAGELDISQPMTVRVVLVWLQQKSSHGAPAPTEYKDKNSGSHRTYILGVSKQVKLLVLEIRT